MSTGPFEPDGGDRARARAYAKANRPKRRRGSSERLVRAVFEGDGSAYGKTGIERTPEDQLRFERDMARIQRGHDALWIRTTSRRELERELVKANANLRGAIIQRDEAMAVLKYLERYLWQLDGKDEYALKAWRKAKDAIEGGQAT